MPPAETPDGPLQFRVSSDRGKSTDAGKRHGKSREILVTLLKPFTARHPEIAPWLDQPVKVSDVSGHRQEECRLMRYAGSVGKDGPTVRAVIATGNDGHKWLGAVVTVEEMQPELGLE